MAPPKRKHPSGRSTKVSKRPKYAESSDDEASPTKQLWEAVCILQERRVGRKLQYLIQWKGTDPATGQDYLPTWEPEQNPNEDLLTSWIRAKASRPEKKPRRQARPSRKSRIVERSSAPSTAPSHASTPHRESPIPPVETPTPTAASRAQADVRVQVQPPGDFDPDEYERYSQLAASRSPSRPSDTQGTDLDSSQLFAAGADSTPHYDASRVVQDSQSSAGEGSFVPPTQQTTSTTQQSSPADGTQEDVTEDSGLLEIVQEAASCAHSPARSIPETVYDTAAESQSQLAQHIVSTTPLTLQQAGSQAEHRAGLTEHSEPDETAQFPFLSPHPLHHSQTTAQTTISQSLREEIEHPIHRFNAPTDIGALEQTGQQDALPKATSAISPILASSHNEHQHSQAKDSLLVASTQVQDDELLSEFLEPEYICSQSPTVAQLVAIEQETVVQSTYASHNVEEEAVRHWDFALESQPPGSTDQLTASREQNAQIVHPNNDLSTQDLIESIQPSIEQPSIEQPSIEKEDGPGHSSPASRHDSSQDTPEPPPNSIDHSSSPIPQPPSHSLGTLESQVPTRPRTPVPTSSLSVMASQDTGKAVEQRMKDLLAEKKAQNPFTPTRRMRKSAFSPSTSATPAGSPNPVTSSRRLLRTGASPSAAAEGTRSPSTVPDRSPAPPAPTSLRTVALTHASQPLAEETREETAKALSASPPPEVVPEIAPVVPAIVTTEPTVPDEVSTDDMELSEVDIDDDNDTASLLNDDLQLAPEEYIVPLFIEGRQSDMYSAYMNQKIGLLDAFVKDVDGVQTIEQVEEVLSYFKAIETHIDLVFAEAGSAPDHAMDSATQVEFAAQFGMENSAKFRFLHWLFHTLRNHEKHVVLVVEEDSDKIFDIMETFCKANFIHYSMPTRGLEADPADFEGNLLVSIFPSSTSPIIRPANLIVCLDGVQDASHIRQKHWAANPDVEVVPILHLVIPRTVGHIERYLSSSLDKRQRMHTIFASLAQMRGELGRPIDENTPRAPRAACIVADWLIATHDDRGSLPLTSIGSVKDVIEYQTQGSQASVTSPVPERAKRPHDDEELDPAKRMRFTPQPQPQPTSGLSINEIENEITRVSDSMPGTATDNASMLQAQLVRIEEAYRTERAAREAEKAQFAEHEAMWDRQQTVHEDQVKKYRLLLGKQTTTEQQLETTMKNNETLRERLATRTTDIHTLTSQLDQQRTTDLLSDDAKIAEITRLRKDLALANEEKIRAQKAQESVDKMLDYTKEEYRKASDAAGTSASLIASLEAQNAQLAHAASGQPATLKKMHLDRQYENLALQLRNSKAENMTLKKALAQKEDELQRARLSGERMGVRTRGTSATPQPSKVRSRAASPSGGRLANLRNG
ncbi:hypothetical protein CC86DRAFT_369916 [Ophiobolus disseminans]|uniref:Chromo domain-containing protein n=1 Tax=Ophiobolus disseminans TaxID=1469910 RepID=A0A6A7A091_9PLEO|nr:hypothetical protein CC86DRAFT_369916 [Ophiobolus disseminans]